MGESLAHIARGPLAGVLSSTAKRRPGKKALKASIYRTAYLWTADWGQIATRHAAVKVA
jgi:hypothetical protein